MCRWIGELKNGLERKMEEKYATAEKIVELKKEIDELQKEKEEIDLRLEE